MTVAVGLALFLVAYGTVTNLWLTPDRWYVPRNLLVGGLLLVGAWGLGASPSDLGLAADRLGAGWRWGAATTVVVAGGVGLVLLGARRVPALGALLGDRRARMAPRGLAWHALVRIPLGTAAFEEVAFRGVLLALLWEAAGVTAAVVGSSLVFGLWHVGPTLVTLSVNEVVTRRLAWVTGAVVLTTVAGAALAVLRLVSGSLLAPVLTHWAVNALGLLAAAHWQWRRTDPAGNPPAAGPGADGRP